MRVKYKPWALDYLKSSNLAFDFFPENNFAKKIKLEIGGGKGNFIVNRSILEPNTTFFMIERVISIAAVALKKIIENKINNINVIFNDFKKISHSIKDQSIDEIYLNFPDPWPKKKHEKRRLTSDQFLEIYHRILKKNGKLIFKTDQKDLYEYTKNKIINQKEFVICLDDSNYNNLDKDDILTEYEIKFRQNNQNIYRLIVKNG